jgi:hypothetical protein
MSDAGISRPELVTLIVKASVIGVFSYLAFKWTIEALDPTKKQKKEAQEKVSIASVTSYLQWTNYSVVHDHHIRHPVS